MRVLVIGPIERVMIQDLVDKAARNVTPLGVVMERAGASTTDDKGTLSGPEPDEAVAHTIEIPDGFRVTYTVEQQPAGPCRHMSVSVKTLSKRRGPSVEAVQTLMREFGFINPLERTMSWLEDTSFGRMAINIVEPLDGNWEPFRK